MKKKDLRRIIREEIKALISSNSKLINEGYAWERTPGRPLLADGGESSSKGNEEKIKADIFALRREMKKDGLTEVQAMNMDTVPYNTIMKMKPGSTIKMKDGKIRTKDKFGNWRADTDPNDIIANRDVIKHMKGMKGFNIGNGRVRIEGKLTEANPRLASGLKPLLQVGATINKNAGEDALIKLSDKFDRIDDEYADDIASHLNMAIELIQDRSPSEARAWLNKFNKACKDALSGKSTKSAFEGIRYS